MGGAAGERQHVAAELLEQRAEVSAGLGRLGAEPELHLGGRRAAQDGPGRVEHLVHQQVDDRMAVAPHRGVVERERVHRYKRPFQRVTRSSYTLGSIATSPANGCCSA